VVRKERNVDFSFVDAFKMDWIVGDVILAVIPCGGQNIGPYYSARPN
jgi:hypothetical protein